MDCRKRSFRTRAEAREFAKANKKRNGHQRPYRCTDNDEHQLGGVWHLTSQRTTDITWYRDNPNSVKNKRREQ